MTDSERIKLLEETVVLMCKCLDVQRFLKLSENQRDTLMGYVAKLTADKENPDADIN